MPAPTVVTSVEAVSAAARTFSVEATTVPNPPVTSSGVFVYVLETSHGETLPWLSRARTRNAAPWPAAPLYGRLVAVVWVAQSSHGPPSTETWTS